MLRLVVGLTAFLAAAPAFAHHAMDGAIPNSFATGLISGLAHPVLGLDHFAFILAAGLLAAPRARGLVLPLAFVIASAVGSLLHLGDVDLPAGEIMVAGSVLLLGLLLVLQRRIGDGPFAAILALAGLFHGYAFAESIFGAEQSPLAAYLIGLAIMEYVIAAGTALVWRFLDSRNATVLPQLSRVAGACVVAVGAFFLITSIAG